jgi:hypothetical protein
LPYASVTADIDAPVDTVWRILLEKIEDPGGHGVQSCEILESTPTLVIRRIQTRTAAVTERVTIDEAAHEIRFTLLDHRHLIGYVSNHAEARGHGGSATTLTFVIDVIPKDPSVPDDQDLEPILRAAAEEVKAIAESRSGPLTSSR